VSDEAFPDIATLVPHSGPMCLLDRVLEHTRERTLCEVDPAGSRLLANSDGSVPAWVALEYMAQCIAVHGGLAARARGEAPRPGLLLGSRRIDFAAREFAPGEKLRVSAAHHRGELGLAAFDCAVFAEAGGDPLVRGRLNVYIVEDWQQLADAGGGDA
jgi:predicted hotdog family 3-hydroxylacyl-ACP dehydratase